MLEVHCQALQDHNRWEASAVQWHYRKHRCECKLDTVSGLDILISNNLGDLLHHPIGDLFVELLPQKTEQIGEQQKLQEDCHLNPNYERNAAMLRCWRVV